VDLNMPVILHPGKLFRPGLVNICSYPEQPSLNFSVSSHMRLKEEYCKKFVDNELEKIKRYKSKSSTKPYKIGVCVECKVRDGDFSGQKFFPTSPL